MSDARAQIAFAFGRLAALLRAGAWQAAASVGLNPAQIEIIGHLARRGPVRQGDLAEALSVSAASLSDSVASLARKGLVVRAPDPQDGRALQVSLSAEGKTIAASLPPAPEALVIALDTLSERETGDLLRTLTRLIRSLQEARAIPVQKMCVTCRYFRPRVHAEADRPHHCAFVNAAFGDAGLRLDCGEHEAAPLAETAAAWRRFEAA